MDDETNPYEAPHAPLGDRERRRHWLVRWWAGCYVLAKVLVIALLVLLAIFLSLVVLLVIVCGNPLG